MRMKSYFVASVQAAIEQAREELGPDAMLVESRKAPPEAQGLGEYEVVFAILPEGAGSGAKTATTAAAGESSGARQAQGPADAAVEDPVMRELGRLRKQVEEMGSSLAGLNAHASSWALPSPEFAETLTRLVENDFAVEVATKIVKQAHARLEAAQPVSWPGHKAAFDRESIERAVRAELEALITVDADLGTPAEGSRVAVLVGPPGSGKTSTLVKLAVRYGLTSPRPVHLITTDTRRVSAAEQLRTYASIIGAGFDVAETTRGLQQTIEAYREKGLILVDTPGYAAADMEEAGELACFLSRQPGVEIHLVVPASMRAQDLARTLDRFEIFSPAKLIFTRLDETACFGALVSESARTGRAVSFLAAGQQIPEDLEPATRSRLVELVFERQRERALSAA